MKLKKKSIGGILAVLFLTLVFFGLNVVWRVMDTTPAHWDMARHLSNSYAYLDLFTGRHFKTFLGGYFYYPPMYYWLSLPFFGLFGWSVLSATAVNLWFMLILAFSAYFISKRLFGERLGILSAFLVLTLPMVSAQFKEYQLDAPMSAMALAGIAALYYTDGFKSKKFSLLFGLIFGMGMLTKWTYFLFVLPPACYVAVVAIWGQDRLKRIINMFYATLIGFVIVYPWYWANHHQLRIDFTQGGITSAILEGDPVGLTWKAFTWYFWSFLENHLWLIGTVLAFAGLVAGLVRKELRSKLGVVLISVIVGYLACFKLDNKDARYIMPVVVQMPILTVALVSLVSIRAQKIAASILVVIGVFTFSETTFGLPFSKSVTLRAGANHSAVLFTAGSYTVHPPKSSNWRFDEIFTKAKTDATTDVTIQLLGRDCPEFNRWDLAYYTKMYGMQWVGENLAVINYRYLIVRAAIEEDLVGVRENLLKLGYTTTEMGEWRLPDGSRAYLLKVEAVTKK